METVRVYYWSVDKEKLEKDYHSNWLYNNLKDMIETINNKVGAMGISTDFDKVEREGIEYLCGVTPIEKKYLKIYSEEVETEE